MLMTLMVPCMVDNLMMVPWWFGWWWCWRWSFLLMMQPLEMVEPYWRCLVDALCLHSLHWCMWLDPMLYDALEPWVSLMMETQWWLLDDGLGAMMVMTWYIDVMPWWALLEPWWHDTLIMTWYIHVMPCLLMRIPYLYLTYSCASPIHLAHPFLIPNTSLNPSLYTTLPLYIHLDPNP